MSDLKSYSKNERAYCLASNGPCDSIFSNFLESLLKVCVRNKQQELDSLCSLAPVAHN